MRQNEINNESFQNNENINNIDIICKYNNVKVKPSYWNNNTIICPCLAKNVLIDNSQYNNNILFQLFIGNIVDSILQLNIKYFEQPKVFIKGSKNILIGQSTDIVIKMKEKNNKFGHYSACKLPVNIFNQNLKMLKSQIEVDGTLICKIYCEVESSVILQMTTDTSTNHYFDVDTIKCIPIPIIITCTPTSILESKDPRSPSIIEIILTNLIETSYTFCIFGTRTPIPVLTRSFFYKGVVQYMRVSCSIPPNIPVGLTSVAVGMGGVLTAPAHVQILPTSVILTVNDLSREESVPLWRTMDQSLRIVMTNKVPISGHRAFCRLFGFGKVQVPAIGMRQIFNGIKNKTNNRNSHDNNTYSNNYRTSGSQRSEEHTSELQSRP